MNYVLMIQSSPYYVKNSLTAYLFAQTLIRMQHKLRSIFFYSEGVFHVKKFNLHVDDNIKIIQNWKNLSLEFNIKLYTCSNAVFTRNLISYKNYKKNIFTEIDSQFILVGLAVLTNEIQKCDRVLQL